MSINLWQNRDSKFSWRNSTQLRTIIVQLKYSGRSRYQTKNCGREPSKGQLNQKFGKGSGRGWATLRRPPGDITKAALEWNPQGTRPRKTWRRTILEEIRHQSKTWKEVKVIAKNRVRWRNFVKSLCSLEEWWETIYIQGVTGGKDQTSGGCSLC